MPDGVADELAPERALELRPVDVRDVSAQDERRLPGAGRRWRRGAGAGRELDRVRPCVDERRHRALQILDPGEERRLPEEAVVDGDVEAAPVGAKRRFRRGLAICDLLPPARLARANDRVAHLGRAVAVLERRPVGRDVAVLGDRRQEVVELVNERVLQPIM